MIYDFLIALTFAVLLTALFAGVFRRPGPFTGVVFFFLIVFLTAWAGGLWISPFGPVFLNVFWVPYLISGLICALLLAASTPDVPSSTTRVSEDKREVREGAAILSFFLWGLLMALVIAVIFGYTMPRVTVV